MSLSEVHDTGPRRISMCRTAHLHARPDEPGVCTMKHGWASRARTMRETGTLHVVGAAGGGNPCPRGQLMSIVSRALPLALCFVVGSAALDAANKEQGRLENCGVVMQEVLDVPDNIPQELLEKAECVIVIPSMTKLAMGVGGSYGRGAMVCRTGKMFKGPWGAPAMYSLEGGSFGLQLGGESTDVVLLVMNDRGVEALLDSKVKLGGNASAAAGPKGRNLEAATDVTMRAEILSYSRSRGLFAGVSLEGTSLRADNDATEQVYGRKLNARQILSGRGIAVPVSGQHFVDVLTRNAPYNESKKTSNK